MRLGVDMHIRVQKMLDDEMHPGLSNVDYTLLLAAMERPNMDVMTDDKALSGAISNRRDSKANEQIRSATSSYCKRRWFTARSVKRKLGNYIPGDARPSWEDGLTRTEFLINGVKVGWVDHSKEGNVRVNLAPLAKKLNKEILKLRSELEVQVRKDFFGWRPKEGRTGSKTGQVAKKEWYRRLLDDDVDMLDKARLKSVTRKLQSKGLADRGI